MKNFVTPIIILLVICLTGLLWFNGLLSTDLFGNSPTPLEMLQDKKAPHDQAALGYWLRYPDVAESRHWGKNSKLGEKGPAEHYRLYGKKEGRILAPVVIPEDMELEKRLAEIYWQRYPKVEESPLWGRLGFLGVLGPRDHYLQRGKAKSYRWGE